MQVNTRAEAWANRSKPKQSVFSWLELLLLLMVLFLSGADGLSCDPSISLSEHNWEQNILSNLNSNDFVVLCLPQQGTKDAWPDISVCDQIDEMGKGIIESMADDSATSFVDLNAVKQKNQQSPSTNNNTFDGKQRAKMCTSEATTNWKQEAFTVSHVEYTTTGSVLSGDYVMLHLLLSKDLPNSLIVALSPPEDLPQGNYYVRSYRLKDKDDADDDDDQLCVDNGMAMVMYMRGFFASTKNKSLPCLAYYFSPWVLRDKGHFWGALWYSFLLALLTQGLSAVRAVVHVHVHTTRTKKICLLIIYTVQQLLGYLIMLVAMMYSVELLFAVVVGVMVGNKIFVKGDPPVRRRKKPRSEEQQQLQEPLLAPNADGQQPTAQLTI